MKVLVAGATGVLGRQLVPRLLADGHDVVGMTRSRLKLASLRAAGATAVVADALDPEAMGRAVAEAEPEVIVHQLTSLPSALDMRHFDRDFASTTTRPPSRNGCPRSRARSAPAPHDGCRAGSVGSSPKSPQPSS